MHKFITALAVTFFIFIVWIIYLANTGGSSVFFDLVRSIPYGDKLGHFCLFGFLTLVVVAALRFRTITFGRFQVYYGAILVAVFALGEELSQALLPSRTFDFLDLTADALGILAASLVASLVNKKLRKKSS
ncbi:MULTISPECIES: VanZ family protein [unclassified Halomonas]|uniref:VanZ family protein n=1 Tax=unclassified Halomonas TaxID=2609666 RepID=UPI0009908690|nr:MULTISPECIES: VanZ family protein [unclassified Halomonas]AQU81524.1 trypsin [Halomonas sp. 'Soap Lake \